MATEKPVKTPVERDYEVLVDGWIAGAHRRKGSAITLLESAAKYEVLGGKLELKKSRPPAHPRSDAPKPPASSKG